MVMLLRAILGSDPGKAALAVVGAVPGLPVRHRGRRLLPGRLVHPAHVRPLPGRVRGGAAVRPRDAVRGAARLAVGDHRPGRRHRLDMVERSFAPFVHDGFCMDLVSGRGVGRQPYGDHGRGRTIAAAILLLAETGLRRRAGPLAGHGQGLGGAGHRRAHARGARPTLRVPRPPRRDPGDDDDPRRRRTRRAPAAADERPRRPPQAGLVRGRSAWPPTGSATTSTATARTCAAGTPARECSTGGPRAMATSTPTPSGRPSTPTGCRARPSPPGGWPTAPARRWGDTCPPGRWVGGATDGTYATVGQHLNGFESTMEAFKSWFFLDDAVVCLGAGHHRRATACRSRPSWTTAGPDARSSPWTTRRAGRTWRATAATSCPGPSCARCARTAAAARSTRSYVTLWLDHGDRPGSRPATSTCSCRARARRRPGPAPPIPAGLRVLVNTGRQQGVQVPSLGITAVNFWNAGAAGGLTASAPCAVLVRERARRHGHGDRVGPPARPERADRDLGPAGGRGAPRGPAADRRRDRPGAHAHVRPAGGSRRRLQNGQGAHVSRRTAENAGGARLRTRAARDEDAGGGSEKQGDRPRRARLHSASPVRVNGVF